MISIACGCGFGAGTAAADYPETFLVPGTRSPIVVADRSFAIAGVSVDAMLERSFGVEGSATARFSGVEEARADAAATQPDGKIVISGYAQTGMGISGVGISRRVAVARFLPSGRPDRGFGGGDGVVVTRQAGRGSAIAPLAGGGLLIAGRTGGQRPMLLRMRPGGALDRSFGRGGVAVLRPRDTGSVMRAGVTDLVLGPEGTVVASIYQEPAGEPGSTLLARYLASGRLDRRFGSGGVLAFEPPGAKREAVALAGRRDGGLVAVTGIPQPPCVSPHPNCATHRLAVAALRPDGRLDRTYGREAIAVGPLIPWLGFDAALTLDREGRPLVATMTNFQSFSVARFTQAGRLDSKFGGSGEGATSSILGRGPLSIDARPGGDIVVLASDLGGPGAAHLPVLARFSSSGNGISRLTIAR